MTHETTMTLRPAAAAPSLGQWTLALVRAATGLLLVPHGAQKLFGWFGGRGLAETAAFLAKSGYPASTVLAPAIGLLEFFGGIALAIGLLTRPVAAIVVAFMAGAVMFHAPNGFFWTNRGFEVPLLWGIVALHFALAGAGPLSVDARLFRSGRR